MLAPCCAERSRGIWRRRGRWRGRYEGRLLRGTCVTPLICLPITLLSGQPHYIQHTSLYSQHTHRLELIARQRPGLLGHSGSPISYPSFRVGLPALPQVLAAVSVFGRSTDLSPVGVVEPSARHLRERCLRSISRLFQLPFTCCIELIQHCGDEGRTFNPKNLVRGRVSVIPRIYTSLSPTQAQ